MPRNGFSSVLVLVTIFIILTIVFMVKFYGKGQDLAKLSSTPKLSSPEANLFKKPQIPDSSSSAKPESSSSGNLEPTVTPLPVKPVINLYSPKGGETMTVGGTFNIFWATANLPTDRKNWELIASLTSSEGAAAEGKTGLTIFSLPLNQNVGYFTWKVQRSFSDDWSKSVKDLDQVSYQIRLCLVNINSEQTFALGYWNDPSGEGVWCNQNPATFKISSAKS